MPTLPLPNDKCPRCQGVNLRAGRILGEGKGSGVVFDPEDRKFWSFSLFGGVGVETAARACLDCGFIWTEADPRELAAFIAKKCKPTAKRAP